MSGDTTTSKLHILSAIQRGQFGEARRRLEEEMGRLGKDGREEDVKLFRELSV